MKAPRGAASDPRRSIVCEGPVIKSLIRPGIVLLLVAAITLPVAADKAKTLYEKAKDAEARQDYEQAFQYYKQAYDLKPRDLKYRAPYERTKFLAAASHVHRGQLLRDAGKIDEASKVFGENEAVLRSYGDRLKSDDLLINASRNGRAQRNLTPDLWETEKKRLRNNQLMDEKQAAPSRGL